MTENKPAIYAIVNVIALIAIIGLGAYAVFASSGGERQAPFSASDDSEIEEAEAQVLVTVNGEDITIADLVLAEQEFGAQLASIPRERQMMALVEYLIQRKVISQKGRAAGMASDEQVQRRVSYYTDKAIRDVYLGELAKDRVTEEDLKALYEERIKTFTPQEEIHARHILVENKAKAEEAIAKIRSGMSFENVAMQMSTDGSAQSGGDLGYFVKDQMVEAFAEAAFAMKPGDMSDPVETQFGWHVIKVEDKRVQEVPPFEEVRDGLYSELMREESRAVAQELREEATVDYAGDPQATPEEIDEPTENEDSAVSEDQGQ